MPANFDLLFYRPLYGARRGVRLMGAHREEFLGGESAFFDDVRVSGNWIYCDIWGADEIRTSGAVVMERETREPRVIRGI